MYSFTMVVALLPTVRQYNNNRPLRPYVQQFNSCDLAVQQYNSKPSQLALQQFNSNDRSLPAEQLYNISGHLLPAVRLYSTAVVAIHCLLFTCTKSGGTVLHCLLYSCT
jgi:hypothetical protein